MADKRNILNFQADDELIKRLEDYRFDNRINTMSEAIRMLLDESLKKYEKQSKE